MQAISIIAALAGAALAAPGAVTSAIAPPSPPPAGCQTSRSGTFELQVVKTGNSKVKRDALTITLNNGVLVDSAGRTGYIASNNQFQFDKPPQAGAIYTAGWSVCANSSISLGGSSIFYECLSGTFYNLYDVADAAQCIEVYLDAVGGSVTAAGVSTQADGQITAAAAASAASVVCQIGDGQLQQNTCITSIPVITQIGDGQIQAPTATAPVVSQIGDGQPQAPKPTAGVVTQIGDGQIQAPKSVAGVVSQISDGQPQAPKPTSPAVANTNTSRPAPVPYTGAAAAPVIGAQFFGLAAGIIALAAL